MSDVVAQRACEKCGADISTEQIVAKAAGLVNGILLCPHCVEEKRKELLAAAQQRAAAASGADESLTLVDESEMEEKRERPQIVSFARGSTLGGGHDESHLKRSVASANEPATRCRTFHSKLTPAALAHMDEQINDWLDNNPGIFMKHITATVGPFEAKHVEQHLILNIFY
ncbi:MAG TPA: hypothetical protein VMV81_14215 [Phycisphaerae bacterium]|nr:hypothetical protein [Phycisphaerae bacterium]